jgi:hypothetical protein
MPASSAELGEAGGAGAADVSGGKQNPMATGGGKLDPMGGPAE